MLRIEYSRCDGFIVNRTCMIAFAEYSVAVSDNVDKTRIYDILTTRTQESIEAGQLDQELQATVAQFYPHLEMTVDGASFPPFVADDKPTGAPSTNNPTSAPENDNNKILGLSMGAFIGIIVSLVVLTCVAGGLFVYAYMNHGAPPKNVSTKDASEEHDAFDDEHDPERNDNDLGINSFGLLQPASGFFGDAVKKPGSSSSGSEEEKPADRAGFGYEAGGPGEFNVEIEGDDSEDSSVNQLKKEAAGDDGFGNDFPAGDSNAFFGGGGATGWPIPNDSSSSSNADGADGFGFSNDEASAEESGSGEYDDEEEAESGSEGYDMERYVYCRWVTRILCNFTY